MRARGLALFDTGGRTVGRTEGVGGRVSSAELTMRIGTGRFGSARAPSAVEACQTVGLCGAAACRGHRCRSRVRSSERSEQQRRESYGLIKHNDTRNLPVALVTKPTALHISSDQRGRHRHPDHDTLVNRGGAVPENVQVCTAPGATTPSASRSRTATRRIEPHRVPVRDPTNDAFCFSNATRRIEPGHGYDPGRTS